MTKKYGKLVRDNIPDIIRRQGKTPVVRTLSGDEYRTCLNQKLQEEVNEYLENNCLEELCDILEVVEALIESMDLTADDAARVKQTKAETNGKFKNRLYLEEIRPEAGSNTRLG